MSPVLTRKILALTGNGTNGVKIEFTPNKRVHKLTMRITFAATTLTEVDTLAEQLAALTIKVKTGTKTRRELNGTQLRDYCLLNGTIHDFDAVSTYVAIITIPFAEDWFFASVADALAWNPARVGPISVELSLATASGGNTMNIVAYESVSDDLDADSAGIITWEYLTLNAATQLVFTKEVEPRGRLIQATIYPDTGSNATTQAALMVGPDNAYAWQDVPVAENADYLGRAGLTPSASGRTASLYDMVFVRGDALAHSVSLLAGAKFDIRSGAASGANKIVLARLEPN